MKVSIAKVEALKKSNLIHGYEVVIKAALASEDPKRTKAAKELQLTVNRLNTFFECCPKWETKKGYYIVPPLADKLMVSINAFIKCKRLFEK